MNFNQNCIQKKKRSEIDVNITDFILTPLSCAALINEIIKSLLHQKCQIPYSYAWLKHIINKKRDSDSSSGFNRNLSINRHLGVVSNAFDACESIMKAILNEFRTYDGNVAEIVVVFGSTTVCPKEVFTIRVPAFLGNNHIEANHQAENSKKIQKVLRNIFLSEDWMGGLDNSLSCTNTYFYIKKLDATSTERTEPSAIFYPSKPLFVAQSVKHVTINLNYENNSTYSCCDNLQIFTDVCDKTNELSSRKNCKTNHETFDNGACWTQSKAVVQGYKDCFINKTSASELW